MVCIVDLSSDNVPVWCSTIYIYITINKAKFGKTLNADSISVDYVTLIENTLQMIAFGYNPSTCTAIYRDIEVNKLQLIQFTCT